MTDEKTESGSESAEATENANGGAENQGGENKGPQFAIERIYAKDVSLETPKGFEAFTKQLKPRVDLDINTSQTVVSDDRYEVNLRLTITVRDQESEEVHYLIEVNQAGIFAAIGFSEEDRRRVLATAAPSTLFPYARETIDSMVTKAGFAPLRLAPINFDALLHAAVAQREADEAAKKGSVQ